MTVVPEPDFDLCLCLLNDALINDESVAKLIQLKQLLDGARFAEFWATLDDAGDDGETRELVADVVNFDDLVRQLVARTIAASHRTIARGLAQKFLNISAEAAFATFAQECGWTVEAQSGLVHIPPNTSNQATVAVVNEQLGLGQMSKLLSASATPIGL
ncbi:hypothetical protein GQ42DRAFT_161001 [Ramicandelaber brevisporus]|nr:hypothetical protein GQ42DRAFT_161001 [Ramicandelaber brevisporus]